MRRVKVSSIIMIFTGVITVAGCGVGGLETGDRLKKNIGEDIDPFSYGDEFALENFNKQTPYNYKQREHSGLEQGINTGNTVDALDNEGRQIDSKILSEEFLSGDFGYRIQIGNFEDKAKADKMADYARLKVDLNVYVVFEVPFYRVRLGDFKLRTETEKYVKILKDIGFKESLWIRTKVNIQ